MRYEFLAKCALESARGPGWPCRLPVIGMGLTTRVFPGGVQSIEFAGAVVGEFRLGL
jgi:hypothetical protein